MPIEGVIQKSSSALSGAGPLRVRHIEGYCQNIPKGEVRVGINVGNCAGYGFWLELSVPDNNNNKQFINTSGS